MHTNVVSHSWLPPLTINLGNVVFDFDPVRATASSFEGMGGPAKLGLYHKGRDFRRFAMMEKLLFSLACNVKDCERNGVWPSYLTPYFTEVAGVLFDIASDKAIYVFDEDVLEGYVFNVFRALAVCVYAFFIGTSVHQDRLAEESLNVVHGELDRLYTLLWLHREWLTKPTTSKTGRTRRVHFKPNQWPFAQRVLRLASITVFLNYRRTNPFQAFFHGRFYQVLLHCWITNRQPELDRIGLDALQELNLYDFELGHRQWESAISSLVKEVVTPEIADTLTTKVFATLADPSISERVLYTLLDVSNMFFLRNPLFANPSSGTLYEDMLRQWCIAIDRRICSGGLMEGTHGRSHEQQVEEETKILVMAWKLLGTIFMRKMQGSGLTARSPADSLAAIWFTTMNIIGSKIILLMAYTIEHHMAPLGYEADILLCGTSCSDLIAAFY
ncbi:hypothetical protein BC835DRAFT_859287 [Cytidiella melzeri]|nr:hypothetical protein BC835DRAFT_859287 [Cytidiella melzeri]